MATFTLNATPRTETGKGAARALRREGRVPAVIYGHGREAQGLSINARELEKLLDRATGSTVIELALDGKTSRTLIREIQRHPFKKQFIHVDFQELVAGEKIVVDIPIVFRGVPEGVRVGGGIMDQILHSFSCEVDPSNIPDHIDVDVSKVTIGHSLHVSDIAVPAGVTILDEPEAAVVVVAAPKTGGEATTETVSAPAEPELIRKPKADDEK